MNKRLIEAIVREHDMPLSVSSLFFIDWAEAERRRLSKLAAYAMRDGLMSAQNVDKMRAYAIAYTRVYEAEFSARKDEGRRLPSPVPSWVTLYYDPRLALEVSPL